MIIQIHVLTDESLLGEEELGKGAVLVRTPDLALVAGSLPAVEAVVARQTGVGDAAAHDPVALLEALDPGPDRVHSPYA